MLPISPVLLYKVSKIVFPRASGVRFELHSAEYYLTKPRFNIGCIMYISVSLVSLPAFYERFPVEIPAGWEKLATQSLVIIRTTNREFDSELFINK